MMPNLPGATLMRDKKMFEELFSNPEFKPDMIKIYPCAILREAKLYRYWKQGKYKPYTEKQLFNLIKSIKQIIPYYTRIQRIIRDIPAESIAAGPAKISNMRQQLIFDMKRNNWKCSCIRCREVGENYNKKDKLKLFREDYNSSGGKEIFLSVEDLKREKIYSLLRLRIPSQIFDKQKHYISELEGCAIIREVHTYGQLHSFVGTDKKAAQHKGLGKKLITEAEKIAKKEFELKKISVISGIGVKGYYKKLGYRITGTYLTKKI
jgi:elongator complex protein 3